MQTQSPPSSGTETRSRSTWMGALWVVIVLAVGLGIWAVVALTGQDDLEVATERMDEWVASWNDEDPDANAAIFTEDGVYEDPLDRGGSSRDEILVFAREHVGGVWNVSRTGEGMVTESGTFVFPVSFDWAGGSDTGEIEVELDGDLVSRLVWLHWTAPTD